MELAQTGDCWGEKPAERDTGHRRRKEKKTRIHGDHRWRQNIPFLMWTLPPVAKTDPWTLSSFLKNPNKDLGWPRTNKYHRNEDQGMGGNVYVAIKFGSHIQLPFFSASMWQWMKREKEGTKCREKEENPSPNWTSGTVLEVYSPVGRVRVQRWAHASLRKGRPMERK